MMVKYSNFNKTSKTGLQRPAARYDGIGKIGGGYGFLVSMVSRVVSRCPWLPSWGPWLPKFVPCYLKWSLGTKVLSLVEVQSFGTKVLYLLVT